MTMRWYCWPGKLFLVLMALTSSSVMADKAYTLGAGDRVQIVVYGQEDLTTEAEVSAEGTLSMPLVGHLNVEGLSAPAAAEQIASRLEKGGFLQSPHVNLLVEEYRSKTIAALGQVRQPGRVVMTGPTSLTEALAMAGGINERGGERIVLVRVDDNGEQTKQEFNLRELLDSQAQNRTIIQLRNGDVLYVPVAAQFYVHGQVNVPGTYILDRPLNVMQALSVSGGLNRSASQNGLTLYRKQSDGSVVERKAELDDIIQDGDVLFVKESFF